MFTKADAEAYFIGEKTGSLVFMIMGLVAIVAAALLFFYYKTPLTKGISIPLLVVALIHISAGYVVYNRADKQRADAIYNMDLNPDALQNREVPRMEKVMKNFSLYRYVEIGLLIIGLAGFFWLRQQPEKQFLAGICLGLAIQALISFGGDWAAEKRADKYLKGISSYLHAH